jgi:carboxyl-terminal processing protease
MSLDEAVSRLKGPKGTQVRITIVRRGLDQPLALSVTRAEIPQTTVRQSYMLNPTTGYIQVTEFARGTGREVADALEKLRKEGMKQLVVDLRNNGGGLLDQAIEVADQFLPEESTIVQTKGRTRDSFQTYKASGKYPALDVPVVVLVNEGTASASEIFSGALQDHDRGLVVGTPSWGKGLVQTVYNLSYGAGLALTTAKYYTPSGRLIQRDYTSYYDYYTHADAGSPEINGKTVSDDEIYHTDLGRKVYGGGGITPDVLVKAEEQPELLQFLEARNAFFEFGVEYTSGRKISDPGWTPSLEVLRDFERWVKREGMIEDETDLENGLQDADTRREVLSRLRAEIFNATLGNDVRYRVLAEGDHQIQQALGLFGKASDLLAMRKNGKGDSRVVAGAGR